MRAEPLSPPHALPVRKPQFISTSPHIDTLKPLEPYCSGGHTDTMHCTLSWSLIHASFSPRSLFQSGRILPVCHTSSQSTADMHRHIFFQSCPALQIQSFEIALLLLQSLSIPPTVLPLGLIQPHLSLGEGRFRCYACNVNVSVLWNHMYYYSSMWVCVEVC